MRNRSTRRLGMDLMMMLFLAMASVLMLVLPYITIPEQENTPQPPTQGNLMVELYWDDELATDVDLWVWAEADNTPVGYSNKGSPLWNLLRDDLGYHGDISGRNAEMSFSRGIPNGKYAVNVHLFNPKGESVPISVKIVVSLKRDDNDSYTQLFVVNGDLLFKGHEKTMARFEIKDKELVPGSFNTLSKKLRELRNGGPP